ncbi:elongation of very long chain fatty acids protein 4-like [Bradysia coprophila]|uniref:elongation of very long chain fatty acids protein 4-like n=1 Tax=Bradysia coprophila TaxID=38358 RepID=UPI00187D8B80|nr:elongation of very long chain fatty acids protein 4-like [Bradysia coprophila]
MEETFRKYELISKKFVDERFLLRTPYPIAGITLLYLFMVFIFIPNYMRDKKPFVLKNVVLVYNVLQIVLNFYVVYSGIPEMFAHNVQFSCPIPNEKLLYTVYWYLLLKIIDLIETGFFALKKKNNQISFLHVYHHVMILSLSYFASVNLKASGQAIYYINVNSCVHFVMYMYYFLSAYNPNSKYIRLKKFVTQVQLIQFVIMLLQALLPLYIKHCYMNIPLVLLGYSQSLIMIFLFGKFYIDNYLLEKIKR